MWGFLKRLTCAKVQTLTPLPAKRGAATDGDAAAAGADTRRRQRDQQAGPVDTAPPGTPKGGAAVRAPPDQEMLLLTPVPTAPPRGAAAPSTPATAECRTPAAAVGQPCQQQRRQQREPRSASAACSSCAPSRSATGRLSSGFLIEGGKTIGIPNTVSKFDPARPLPPTVTPFERRVERKLVEEAEALRHQRERSVER